MNRQTKFKQSKIGMIPEDWKVVELKDILEDKGYIRGPFGSALRRPELKSEGIPVYEQENAIHNSREFRYFIDNEKFQKLSRFTVKENDLIVSCSGTFGKVSIIKKEDLKGIISQALLILRPNTNKINALYLKYFFASDQGFHSIASRSSGSVQINIAKRGIIERIELPLPPLIEQRAIAKILSDLDTKIELNQNMNKTLDAVSQAIFKHWFVDFEFPNENGEPYKSSGGEMVDSEIGLIPKGWNVRSLNQIANFLNGLAMQKYRPENAEDYLPVLKIKELKIGKTSKNSDKCSMNIDPKYIVDDGDVIFSWSGSLEVKLWCGNKAGLNQHLFKVTSANYPKWFYYYWIKHHIEDFRRIAEDKTTTMGHIKREHLSKAKVLDPGKIFFKKFDKVVNGLIELYINNEKEKKYLSQLRDILLPKLMSGEIRVPINSKNFNQLK